MTDDSLTGERMSEECLSDDITQLRSENECLRALLEQERMTTTTLKERLVAMQLLAHEDDLTGLLNRRRFQHEMNFVAPARMSRASVNCGLLFVDVNDFKKINDERGHESGNKALCAIAETLRTILRPFDRIFRYGGDEFVVVFYDVTVEQMYVIANRVVGGVAHIRVEDHLGKFGLSLSIGGAVCNGVLGVDSEVDSFIGVADGNMYTCKRAYQARSSEVTLPITVITLMP